MCRTYHDQWPQAQQTQLPRNVKLLGGVSLLNDIASEMIYPLMPQFLISVLGGDKLHLGIIEGFAWQACSSYGWAQRRFVCGSANDWLSSAIACDNCSATAWNRKKNTAVFHRC